jgi:hypothetical protein
MNLTNQALTNVFSKALIVNSNAPRYARVSFAELVSATMLTKAFQRAVKSAETLFGLVAENKVIKRKLKAKVTKRHAKKHAKVTKLADGVVKVAGSSRRGRPKGSKNKPKLALAESRPLVDPVEDASIEPAITLES